MVPVDGEDRESDVHVLVLKVDSRPSDSHVSTQSNPGSTGTYVADLAIPIPSSPSTWSVMGLELIVYSLNAAIVWYSDVLEGLFSWNRSPPSKTIST